MASASASHTPVQAQEVADEVGHVLLGEFRDQFTLRLHWEQGERTAVLVKRSCRTRDRQCRTFRTLTGQQINTVALILLSVRCSAVQAQTITYISRLQIRGRIKDPSPG